MNVKNTLLIKGKQIISRLLRPADTRERRYSLISFLLPTALLLCAYFAIGLYPFGNKSPLSYDLNGQYAHFFAGLKNILSSGESVVYTWFRTLGGEFLGMIAYYLLSPFNLFIIILPLSMLETAIFLTILCKTGLIGFTSHLYFRRGMGVPADKALIFSTAYSLCSYSVVYGSNLMWLDALIILPLLLWGIERLVKKEGHGLYVFSLAYAMITNYYMGYMLCIVTAAYFLVYLFGEHRDNSENGNAAVIFRTFARLTVYTALALAVSAIVILPAYHSLSFGKTDFSIPDFTPTQAADFLAVLKKTLIGSYDSVGNYGIAFIYSGLPTLIFAPTLFLAKGIGKREKIASGILLAFLFSGFIISTVDLFWHGFQFPNGLNYRHAFIFSFFLCRCSARAFSKQEAISKKSVLCVLAYAVLAIFCIQAQHYGFGDDLTCLWVSLGLLGAYAAIYCYMSSPRKEKHMTLALTVCICFELFIASALSLDSYAYDVVYSKHDSLESYIEKYKPSADAIYEENTGFYRVERVGNRRVNDTLSLGLRGISGSTSTLNASVIELMELMGYGGDSNFANYLDTSPVADTVFGIRYFISDKPIDNGVYVLNESLTAKSEEGVYVYENPYALSAVFSANAAVIPEDLTKYRSVFEANNALLSALTGTELNPFSAITLKGVSYGSVYPDTKSGHVWFVPSTPVAYDGYHTVTFTLPTETGKPVYACFPSDVECIAKIYVNGEYAFELDTLEGTNIRYLGSFDGENITVSIKWNETDLALKSGISYFYQLDPSALTEAYDIISSGQANITEHSGVRLYGSFNYSSALSVLYTTVPYDDDWTLRIDGRAVDTVRASGALLAADLSELSLSEGEHTIEMVYRSSSLTAGAAITLVGALSLLAIHAVNHGALSGISPFNKERFKSEREKK